MVQTKKGSGFHYRYLHTAPPLFCYDAFVRQYHDVNLLCLLLSLTFQKFVYLVLSTLFEHELQFDCTI